MSNSDPESTRIAALAQVAEEVQRKHTLDERLQLLVDRTAELMQVPRVGVRLLDPVRGRLMAVARAGAPLHRAPWVEFNLGEGLIGWVAAQCQPVLSGDAEADPRFVRRRGMVESLGSFVAVPLMRGDTCIGVLYASHRERDQFSLAEQHALTLLAAVCVPHIESARLERLAELDALTGALNRRGAQQVLEGDSPLSVVLCDLDNFKRVNDERGHSVGDAVLCRVSALLASVVRECDAVVRWGGEEFLLVLPGAPVDNAFAVAERARSRVAQEPFGDGSTLHVTLSAGVAERGPNEAVDDLIRRADQALYLAKRGGRDQTRRA